MRHFFMFLEILTLGTQLLEEKGFDALENDARYIAGIAD